MRHHDTATLTLAPADPAARARQRRNEWRAARMLLPYLWEFKARVVVALAFLVVAKLANVGVPLILKEVVDSLDAQTAILAVPLALLAAYGILRFSTTLFAELRDVVFVRVAQRAIRRVALEVFRHLHSLSLRFHLGRQTGGVSRDLERGTRGISTLLSYMLFSIIPVILEFGLVAAVLLTKFDWRFAAITFGAVAVYITFTVLVTEWRIDIRRRANELDSKANTRAIDSLLNYETVKYFGNEEFEARRYDDNLRHYESAAVKSEASLGLLNIGQSLVIAVAVTALMILAAQGVAARDLTLGDLVLVNGLLIQLYIPLNFLGMVYREIKQSLIDMDRMFRLLEENREIADRPGAVPLPDGPAAIRFDGVEFSYEPNRQILFGVSFEIPVGSKVAVVGHSGSGKSTLARLLYRFYDVSGGRIDVSGVDLRDLKQASLRGAIGIVPQDTVLFNDTIRYNIHYGRPEATEDEVTEAARAAHIHDFIMTLPERVRDGGGRAWPQAIGRREAARGDRARHPQEPADPDLRRGDQCARLQGGEGDPGRARPHRGGSHNARNRPPAVDRDGRRPDPGHGPRPDRRARHPPGAPGRRRRVCPDVGAAATGRGSRRGGRVVAGPSPSPGRHPAVNFPRFR